ncbi:MAG: DUF3570 domain-containing protein [Gammaproteobacteria bacterium]
MQLITITDFSGVTSARKSNGFKQELTFATAALLGLSVAAPSVAEEPGPWKIETAGLVYSESDSRVSAFEPVVSAKKEFGEDRVFNAKLVLDSLTGATPTGALSSDNVQTFTRPSGQGSYTIQPDELPIDDTFKDTRVAFSAGWLQPLTSTLKGGVGVNVSAEHDFRSLGLNGNLSKDFNQRNTTLNLGLGFESDTINPEGGVPVAFAEMQPANSTPTRQAEDDDKTVVDTLIGITQVVNKRTLMQFNYSVSQADGYLTDPYKILSVIDDATGLLVSSTGVNRYTNLYENRPDKRTKQSVYWRTKYRFDRDMFDVSYRYLWDDWDIRSHTIDTRYQWRFAPNQYLEPHFRYYQQSEAEFYRPALLNSDVTNNTLPEFASADLRLADFSAITFGAKYAHRMASGSEWHLRLEWYQQSGESSPDGLVGAAKDQDVFPTLSSVIFQAGYAFEW